MGTMNDDNDDEDDHDDGDRDIETYQRWQPVAGKVVTQHILSIDCWCLMYFIKFTSAHIGIVLYCIAIVKKKYKSCHLRDQVRTETLTEKKTDRWLGD